MVSGFAGSEKILVITRLRLRFEGLSVQSTSVTRWVNFEDSTHLRKSAISSFNRTPIQEINGLELPW